MAEERLRRNLDAVFDPGPDFPSQVWLSRTMAAVHEERIALQRRGSRGVGRMRGLLWPGQRLFAIVTLVVLAVVATIAFLAIHRSVLPVPVPAHFPPFQLKSVGAPVCAGKCSIDGPVFASVSVGWLIEVASPVDTNACDPNCHGTSVVFRTHDGGLSWSPSFTYRDHLAVAKIVTSSVGNGVLVVASWGTGSGGGPSLFHSGDGGVTWQSFNLPNAGSVRSCAPPGSPKGCGEDSAIKQVFFLDPREGWAVASASPAAATLYHTTDSGATWSQSPIDIASLQRLVTVLGAGYPSDLTSSLPGQLQFKDSSTGWLIPFYLGTKEAPPFMFQTHDGGLSWGIVRVPAGQTQSGLFGLQFFGTNLGIVRADNHVYASGNAGVAWDVFSTKLPAGEFQFLDWLDWVGLPPDGGWMSTTDGGSTWGVTPPANQQFGSPPLANHGLPKISSFEGGGFIFINPTDGWATVPLSAGPGGLALYRTTDGGMNWTPLTLPELQILGNA
jgi:photosystem II stability/assembly factor-like uncharacterized protein